jgi:Tol biopolymer transport system component/tRNA A-37 threonylcarbamoyl transferase component Bud32
MKPERWQHVKELLNEALNRAPADRVAFIDEHCAGDTELRAEVVSLLESHEEADDFMETPVVNAGNVAPSPAVDRYSGMRIGPYRVVDEIGRGGMGAVYKAVRADDAYRKEVAIKLVKRGMDHDYVLRRFRNERQILATLEHPNVARLLDGGATDDGLPYFVMEYIDGKPIQVYCDEHQLTLRERLTLFRQVCNGVQAAHDRKIVHRDIKPGNILVNEKRQPKLLDFGIAKILDPDLSTQTMEATATVLRMMTPEYASPEQVRGEEITAASDVYSLGVLLYELLTGHRPYRLKTRSPHEIAHIICGEDPEKPSTMVSRTEFVTRGADGAVTVTPEVVSSARRSRPDELKRLLSGDLDNIVLMAMRKEPSRRYASAGALEEDIGRYLDGMPVRARRDTFTYRAGKSIQRNKATVAVGGFALLLGTMLMLAWRDHLQPALNRTEPSSLTPLTSFPGDETQPAFSPDGSKVAFVWAGENGENSDIYIKPVRGPGLERITTNAAEDVSPTWSPDGRQIAWLRVTESDTAIFVAAAQPGAVHGRITSLFPNRIEAVGRHLDWSPDGKYLAAGDRRSLNDPFAIMLVEVGTGHKIQFSTPSSGTVGDSNPAFSPDGTELAFIRAVSSGVDDIFVKSLAGGEARRITSDKRYIISLGWSADGKSILFSSNRAGSHTLWRVAVTGGTPQRVLNVGNNASDPVLSRDGRLLAYAQFYVDANIWEMNLNTGGTRKLIFSTQYDSSPQYSPDGTKVAFRSSRSGPHEIWISSSDGTGAFQLTKFGNSLTGTPRWSPNNRQVAFDSRPEGQPDIFVIDADGSNLRRITNEPAEDVVPSWSLDGKYVYFSSNRGGAWQVWRSPVGSGAAEQVTRDGGFAAFESPDRRYLYYAKGRSAPGLWRSRLDGSGAELVLEGLKPALWGYWGVSDRGIIFADRETAASYALFLLPYGRRDPVRLGGLDKPIIPADSGLAVSPDGSRVLFSQVDQSGSDILIVENPSGMN